MRRLLGPVAVLVAALAASAPAADVVIFNDGFSVQGRRFQEQQVLRDPANGMAVQIPRVRGFDMVEAGPKWFIFSNRTKQVGKILDNVPMEENLREYKLTVYMKGGADLPAFGEYTASDYDKDWKRSIKVDMGRGNWTLIEQRIERITPLRVVIPSVTHKWYPQYDTRELGPKEVRRLLATHPDLVEPDGKADPMKRLSIAQFMKDVGWIAAAREEIDRAKKDASGEWTKDQTERLDKLTADLAKAEARLIADELELAATAGRYDGARQLLARFDDKAADAESVRRMTAVKARTDDLVPVFEQTRKLLRDALDDLGGLRAVRGAAAAAGGAVVPLVLRPTLTPVQLDVLIAGEQVFAELHPDTAARLELFRSVADKAARQRMSGQEPPEKADELVSLAVTGWLMGKNAAEKTPATAAKYWTWRQALLSIQTEDSKNARRAIAAKAFRTTGAAPEPDVLAQLISYLPPPDPDDLANRGGTPVPPTPKAVAGIYKRNTGSLPDGSPGVEYMVRLPSEYHHGRPYPVLLALHQHGQPAEHMVSLLANDADRHGYVIAAPLWCTQFDKPYDWKGDQHVKAQATLRDLLRHYRVDNDRVFAFGFGEGANFALDLGASHPDLFAGVVAMAGNPKWSDMLMVYWPNYQKLPVYLTVGGLAGNSFENLRRVFEEWMPKGFPALATVYRGRGVEWFAAELPTMFDWMRPKKRATGTSTLKLTDYRMDAWQTMRTTDNRFYWLGTDSIAANNLKENRVNGIVPAALYGDIDGNTVRLRTRGLKQVTLWLDRDMIDWSKPVKVTLNNAPPQGYKAKLIEPDLDVMLEQLYEYGDRSLLFLNKLEFKAIP